MYVVQQVNLVFYIFFLNCQISFEPNQSIFIYLITSKNVNRSLQVKDFFTKIFFVYIQNCLLTYNDFMESNTGIYMQHYARIIKTLKIQTFYLSLLILILTIPLYNNNNKIILDVVKFSLKT